MCTPRKWFGTLAMYVFPQVHMISDITTIAVTIPLLLIVVKYISPYIIRLKDESRTIISLFFLLPLTYYILEYAFTVYTDLLYTGKAVIIEFMDSFIVILYFTLSIVTLHLSNKKNTAERKNIILSAAATQAEKEISQLTDYPWCIYFVNYTSCNYGEESLGSADRVCIPIKALHEPVYVHSKPVCFFGECRF